MSNHPKPMIFTGARLACLLSLAEDPRTTYSGGGGDWRGSLTAEYHSQSHSSHLKVTGGGGLNSHVKVAPASKICPQTSVQGYFGKSLCTQNIVYSEVL